MLSHQPVGSLGLDSPSSGYFRFIMLGLDPDYKTESTPLPIEVFYRARS